MYVPRRANIPGHVQDQQFSVNPILDRVFASQQFYDLFLSCSIQK
jgi:hypothetical protein